MKKSCGFKFGAPQILYTSLYELDIVFSLKDGLSVCSPFDIKRLHIHYQIKVVRNAPNKSEYLNSVVVASYRKS